MTDARRGGPSRRVPASGLWPWLLFLFAAAAVPAAAHDPVPGPEFEAKFQSVLNTVPDHVGTYLTELRSRGSPDFPAALQAVQGIRETFDLGKIAPPLPGEELERRLDGIYGGVSHAMGEMSPQGRAELARRLYGALRGVRAARHGRPYAAHLRWLSRRDPGNPHPFVLLSRLFNELGDRRSAVREAGEALRLDPGNVEALRERGNARYRLGEYRPAYEDARAALRLSPDDPAAEALLKLARGKVRFSPEMDRLLTEIGNGAPSREGLAGRAPTAFGGGISSREGSVSRSPTALADGTASVTETPGFSAAFLRASAAMSALRRRDYLSALREADAALRLDPGDVRAHQARAMANVKLGRYEAAAEAARAASRLAPGDPATLDIAARAFNLAGNHGEAKDAADSSLKGDPEGADAWYNLAHAEYGLGNRPAMRDALRRAAGLNPERYLGRHRRAEALVSAGPEDVALLFEEAGSSPPSASAGFSSRPGAAASQRTSEAALPRDSARSAASPPSPAGRVWPFALLAAGALSAAGLYRGFGAAGNAAGNAAGKAAGAGSPAGGDPAQPPCLIRGRYRVLRQAGSGGMGLVYQAVDTWLERPVAVKRMREEIRSDPKELERFLKEARLVAALRHPNIVEIYSVEEDGADVYLIFEFVEGRGLHQVLSERGRLPWPEAVGLMRDVCDALEFAHARNVVHRDLKPSNIMVDGSGRAKVMDFGVARRAKEIAAAGRASLTGTTVAGTPPYMAPEAERGAVRKESDLYSLGICLYELLTGEVPFAGTGAAVLLRKMNHDFTPPSRLVPGLAPAVDAWMDKALQPDPDRRFYTAREFLQELLTI